MTCELCGSACTERIVWQGIMYGDVHYAHTTCADDEPSLVYLTGDELAAFLAAEAEALKA